MKKLLLTIFLSIFLLTFISAAASYCCEKTLPTSDGSGGAWCQNEPQERCDPNFRKVPASCEATSYCKVGTCYDSQEGTCDPNTPQKSCEDAGGVWEEGTPEELPQCQLGCCLIGDQAAFVTQTRCKRLSSLYGLEINFKTNIQNEVQCILSATSDVEGACVFEKEFEKTCLFLTQKECLDFQATSGTEVSFHEGFLCSSESLGTNCGPTEQTKCVEGRDEIYFIDSCGNLANIYDASKIKNKNYWSELVEKADACGFGDEEGNANSASCGNCDYYLGSTCKTKRTNDARPTYGTNICRDLDCTYLGKKYKHGETWCANAPGTDENLPGSRHFRLVCYNGEVTVEPCADYRQEVCLQSEINSFRTAACRVNRWQDCYAQETKQECGNSDRRDCRWIQTSWTPDLFGEGDQPGLIKENGGACLPLDAPGFDFWNTEGDAESLCSIADVTCTVIYEDGIFDSDCEENCDCEDDSWEEEMNNICQAVGDCGGSTNYIGAKGYH